MTLPAKNNSQEKQSVIINLNNLLFSPHPNITVIDGRRQARLTATLSLILTCALGIGLLFRPSSYITFLIIFSFALSSYLLSRTKYFLMSAYLLTFGILVNAFLPLYYGTASRFLSSVYSIVPLTFVLASALLPTSGQVLITIIGISATALAPLYSDIVPPYVFTSFPIVIPDVITSTTGSLILFGLILIGLGRFRTVTEKKREEKQLEEFREINRELEESKIALEERVQVRTQDLDRRSRELSIAYGFNEQRAKQFEAINLVSAALSTIRSLDELLPKITELISQQFGHYHTGIFLIDTTKDYAILSAANSEGGQRMINRGHRLKIGEEGVVGHAISTAKARIALDVGEDSVYFGNPDMPETRSEIALPLIVGGETLGALDVQSTKEAAFSGDDITVLSLLANQVSQAINNARIFEQNIKSLSELETLNRQFLRQAWGRLPKEENLAGYRYNILGSSAIEPGDQGNAASFIKGAGSAGEKVEITVPINIRGQSIGTLSIHVPNSKNIHPDQMDIVNAVAERVALSAETARLFEETNRRAERERLVSDITSKIRSSNDPDLMIQTALAELKVALGATSVDLVPHTVKKAETVENSSQQLDVKKTRNKKQGVKK